MPNNTNEDKKVITSVDDLDESDEEEKEPDAVEPEKEPTVEDEEIEDEIEEEDEIESQPDKGQDEEPVEIDGVKYTKEELEQVFFVGKKVSEYQKEHPGYDPILLHKDYTKKTQELAELKRMPASVNSTYIGAQKDEKKEKADLSKFRKEDLEYFEEVASALGYAKAEDIEKSQIRVRQQTYESVKREEINKFLNTYPEYRPENDSNDLRWGSLRAEFDLYKLPEDPHELGNLLERAHKSLTGFSPTVDSKKLGDIIAKKKAANAGQTSVGGGDGVAPKMSNVKSKKMEQLSKLAKDGALSGYSKEELEELFS